MPKGAIFVSAKASDSDSESSVKPKMGLMALPRVRMQIEQYLSFDTKIGVRMAINPLNPDYNLNDQRETVDATLGNIINGRNSKFLCKGEHIPWTRYL